MKLFLLITGIALALLSVPVLSSFAGDEPVKSKVAPGEAIPAFSAQAVTNLDSAKAGRVTVYYMVGVKCGAQRPYQERVKALAETYRAKGVDFVFIYPNKTDSAEEKVEHFKTWGLPGAMVDDQGGKIARLLEGKKTGEAFIVGKDGKIAYRGGVDDNVGDEKSVKTRYIAQALDEHMAGKAVSVQSSKPMG